MFGFSVRTLQNGFGSPRSVGSPNSSVSSPAGAGAGAGGRIESPKADVGEIDTSAPFQSVKAAVSLFGEVISPRARPVTKKTKAEEQKLVEKETQHHMILKELDHYKTQLRNAESAKAQASRDLQRANKTLQELTTKLETLSESKQAAIKATEAAKRRAKELEEQQSLKAQLGSDAWKLELEAEREHYKASSGELIACKQELANLRQDFDAALAAKLAAFQAIEDARQSAKTNQERHSQLSKEVAMLHQTLDQVKFDSLQAQEEHMKLVAEKEVHLLVHKSAKEAAEEEIRSLRKEYGPEENLKQKLEEATEAVKVLQEQLDDVRVSDMQSLQTITSELDRAKEELQEIVAEETSLRGSVESLKLDMEEVQRKRLEWESKVSEAESRIEELTAHLEKMKRELEEAMSKNELEEMQSSLEKFLAEAERDRYEAEELQKDIELIREEAEAAKRESQETEEKLQIALKEAEKAKAAEKLADEQIHNSPKTDDSVTKGTGSSRKIRLSIDEFKSMNQKIEESRSQADVTVATLMANLQALKVSESEILQKVEKTLKEKEDIQAEIEDALKRAEMAEAARKVVEGELLKWRMEVEDEDAGEPSEVSEEKC